MSHIAYDEPDHTVIEKTTADQIVDKYIMDLYPKKSTKTHHVGNNKLIKFYFYIFTQNNLYYEIT